MTKGLSCIFLALILAGCGASDPIEQEAGADQPVLAGADGAQNVLDDAVPVMGEEINILAFGNSLFAGYGVDQAESYPARLESALRAKGINARIANAGVSGDTTAAGLQRLAFTLNGQEQTPDLVIIELGGNDLLRGQSPDLTRSNIDGMLKELQSRGIDAMLMGMRAPPNAGPEFQAAFDGLYGELAAQYDADLVPFFLESIYQSPELFQDDKIHPTAEGIEQLVEATLDEVIGALPKGAKESEGG